MYRNLVSNAWVRLGARAVLFGLTAFFTSLQAADDPFNKAAVVAAGSAALWAAVEVLLPLFNNTVGVTSGGKNG